ncbi:hypothetical protein CSOJ01_02200 [Colletotrichum sojae]|uniref:Uncharacterized protein n=1 Tax=Colletotrichum sojae TaxID=2175907 RepID=A0A8H6JSA8_9PEZI|nr:hypothetical protein CSOJ01_02200 [Colletotrichum sojae]
MLHSSAAAEEIVRYPEELDEQLDIVNCDGGGLERHKSSQLLIAPSARAGRNRMPHVHVAAKHMKMSIANTTGSGISRPEMRFPLLLLSHVRISIQGLWPNRHNGDREGSPRIGEDEEIKLCMCASVSTAACMGAPTNVLSPHAPPCPLTHNSFHIPWALETHPDLATEAKGEPATERKSLHAMPTAWDTLESSACHLCSQFRDYGLGFEAAGVVERFSRRACPDVTPDEAPDVDRRGRFLAGRSEVGIRPGASGVSSPSGEIALRVPPTVTDPSDAGFEFSAEFTVPPQIGISLSLWNPGHMGMNDILEEAMRTSRTMALPMSFETPLMPAGRPRPSNEGLSDIVTNDVASVAISPQILTRRTVNANF